MTDICLFDLHRDRPTMTEVLTRIAAFKAAHPDYEVLEDGDRYGIFARRKVEA